MYPQPELIRLAARKAVLRQNIALRRVQCTAAATRIARPLAWVDRVVAVWRKISPLARLAALPLALAAGRTLLPRVKMLGTILSWAPAVLGVVRNLGRRQ